MKAEILTIGDELLIGQVIDRNSAWIAEQLNLIGVKVKQISSVSDNGNHIKAALAEASARVDLVLITGGLGPTKDDITKSSLCEYFDTRLVLNYTCNLPYLLSNVISLGSIKRYLSLYGIKVLKIFKSNNIYSSLIIPNYNPYIEREYSSNIYIEILKPNSYYDLYLAINILQLEILGCRLKVYEV